MENVENMENMENVEDTENTEDTNDTENTEEVIETVTRAKTMANRKLEVVRKRLQIEMERLGVDLVIHRTKYISDGSNGYIPADEDLTFDVKGILKSLSTTQAKGFTPYEGGKVYTITDTLSVLYDEGVQFQMYDRFVYNNVKYTILSISNVGEQNVYWLLGVTMEPVEVPRYGE